MTQVLPTTRDAFAQIQSLLDAYGLGSLSNWAWDQIVNGSSPEMIQQSLRERPEFAARFPGIAERKARGLPAVSPNEYLSMERQYTQMLRQAGLPEGFYDQPEDFAAWIGRDVSVAEAAQRVKLAEDAVYNEPPEVIDFYSQFGLGTGDFAALMIDPDRALPLLQRKVEAARTAGAAVRTGYGPLTEEEATRIGTLGVEPGQVQQGFSDLARQRELFQPLDAGENAIGREEQMAGAFGGDAQARTNIENRARRRVGEFQKGGQWVTDRGGFAGIG